MKNILVFPCGSEIGLEIYRSIKNSIHFNLIGASSTDDHGKFVYENYIGNLPYIEDESFLVELKKIIQEYQIEAIFPAMDKVITLLKKHEDYLNVKVISSPIETVEICHSKKKTHLILNGIINTATIYNCLEEVNEYPIFIKPDVGYGSRGAKKIHSYDELKSVPNLFNDYIVMDYLPGEEYTVDCFSDKQGKLLFAGPRSRSRIKTGISVNTKTLIDTTGEFHKIANQINNRINFRGAWFFQLKRDNNGHLALLEIASRIGGSSGVFRPKGINFSLLSLWDAFDKQVEIIENDFEVEMDRSLDCVYSYNIDFDTVYVDFDDTVIINRRVNTDLIKQLYEYVNLGKKLILITKHEGDIKQSLKTYRLTDLFDEIIHLDKTMNKADFILSNKSIFIDDSFAERKIVNTVNKIPVIFV